MKIETIQQYLDLIRFCVTGNNEPFLGDLNVEGNAQIMHNNVNENKGRNENSNSSIYLKIPVWQKLREK